MKVLVLCMLLASGFVRAATTSHELTKPPTDADHPGSENYLFQSKEQTIVCKGREISVFLPTQGPQNSGFPVVVFGHGWTLNVEHYRKTFEHLARKGVAVIFPYYDTGLADTEWLRMAGDFTQLATCAIQRSNGVIDSNEVIYSGHSKGAYIASMAAGLPTPIRPKIVLLLEPADVNEDVLSKMDPSISMTVVYADKDTVTSRETAERTYRAAPSRKKQFIVLKSLNATHPSKKPVENEAQVLDPAGDRISQSIVEAKDAPVEPEKLSADHFWPQTEARFIFGQSQVTNFHYYGLWKWLVGAADDLRDGGHLTNKYLFGAEAASTGIAGVKDEITRNFDVDLPNVDHATVSQAVR